MNINKRFKKIVAWSLIATMVDPAFVAPAFARDTDIFLSVTSGTTTAEPNVLVVLDTSDSMNIPEAWREYAGAYDSHIEYLWNDTTFIYQIGCPIATCSGGGDQFTNALKNQAPPADYTVGYLPQGYFSGVDTTAREAIKQAAINYANAEDPLDAAISGGTDARTIWRNYSGAAVTYLNNGTLTTAAAPNGILTDASWIYWLPAGTPDTDPRLRAPSFNRWRGDRANFATAMVRGGINYGTASTDYTLFNKCTASLDNLLPSTVYHPTSYAKNSGVWLNQQWQRWEPYLLLDADNGTSAAGTYPATPTGSTTANGSTATATSGASVSYNNDFLGSTITPPVGTVPGVPHPAATKPTVDSAPITSNAAPVYFTSNTPGSQGQPVKTIKGPIPAGAWISGDSYSGWGNIKADLGGYVYQTTVNSFNTTTLQQSLDKIYGFATAPNSCFVNTAAVTAANSRNCAYLGNANAPGTPAYYDYRARDLALTTKATGGTTDTRVCAWNTTGPNNANVAAPNDGATTNDFAPSDAAGNNRVWRSTANNFCVTNTTASTGTYAVSTAACAPGNSGQQYTTVNYTGACVWTGRQSIVFEGDPATYYYGGTCGGGGVTTAGGGVAGVPTCLVSGVTASSTVHGQTLTNWVTSNATAGCGNRANVAVSCDTRKGAGACVTTNYAPTCTNQTAVVGTTPGTTTNYGTFNLAALTTNLAHECKADEGGAGPWMTNQQRNFALAWAATSAAGNSNRAAPYTTTSADQITPAAIDMYSVNYLNWKYGPKSNGNPIGRKTRLQIAKDALVDLVNTTDGVRFGLEVFNRLQNADPSNVGSQGGNIAYAITRMGSNVSDTPDYNNRATLATKINSLTATAATPLTEAMFEAMLYFSGRAPRFGTNAAIVTNFGAGTSAAVGGGGVADNNDTNAICTAIGPQCLAIGNYKSPMMNNPNTTSPASCQKNFTILITDGGPDRDRDANTQIKNTFYAGTAGTISAKTTVDTVQADTTSTELQLGASPYGPISSADAAYDNGYVWLDELTYFMSRADISPGARIFVGDAGTDQLTGPQAVITYTVGFAGASSPVLTNAAVAASGNAYTADNAAQLAAALIDALVAIRDWNPTVASPTVPISALNRSENASDVFLAFFKPDTTQAWNGTVKKFRLGQTEAECGTGITLCITGQTTLANPVTCAAANPCKNIEEVQIDPVTSQSTVTVHSQAVSYWANIQDSGTPDLGGTGTQLIGNTGTPDFYTPSTRKVFTFIAGGGSGSNQLVLSHANNAMTEANGPPFSSPTALITKTLLGNAGMTDATRSTLINFIRGGDTTVAACNDASTGTACTTWRTWAHGEVEHSKPAIVTYDSTASPAVQYMYYISNDGLLHAIDTNTGKEKWAFLMEEALPKISSLLADASGAQLDVSDGSPVIYFVDSNGDGVITPGTDTVYLYFGMRRGGRVYYALDITDRDNPAFVWKITAENAPGTTARLCTGIGACANTTAYNELGQTWSSPVIGKVRALGAATPALVFGGGYDPVEDSIPPGTRSMGRALFIVNGLTGAIVQSWGVGQSGTMLSNSGAIAYAIPSDPAAINADVDAQGFLDRVLIGDLGGNVWRFDINALSAAAWTGKQLASLSDASGEKRKIMFPPAIVKQNLQITPGNYLRFDGVYVGTGDREHPLCVETTPPATGCSPPNYAPANKFFLIMDTSIGTSSTNVAPFTFTGGDFLHVLDTDIDGVTPAELSVSTVHGWYRDLENGEKVTNAPTVFFQKLRFGTYSPLAQGNACAPPGQGRLNEIAADSAAYVGLNGTATGVAGDRFYASFLTRGYISTGQVVVLGNTIYHLTVSDARLQAPAIGTLGTATRIYWYMEPEL